MEWPSVPNSLPLDYSILAPVSGIGNLPRALTHPPLPTPTSKNIFAFWQTGLRTLPPYLLRNVIAWYRRFSPLGWTIYVVDTVPDSPLNISCYLDTSDSTVVPDAFRKNTLEGGYTAQHTSDLVRYPLLLKYGGIYLDVGILQFGDLDWLWSTKIMNPSSPYDFAGYTLGDAPQISIVNFAFMCGPNNPLVQRAHRILLRLWEGKTNTTGMHSNPLVSHVPLMRVPQEVIVDDEGEKRMVINDEAMTDYAIQIQAMGSAQRWLDIEDRWDGPSYVREKTWLFSMMDSAFTHEQLAGWSGQRLFDLFCLQMPKPGEAETEDQALARKIVENVIGKSWCLKLSHGFSAKLFGGDTLGMLWRKHDGSDAREGTYAGWLRWAEVNVKQEDPLEPMTGLIYEPTMFGSLNYHLQQ
jgi:hypothetical protein